MSTEVSHLDKALFKENELLLVGVMGTGGLKYVPLRVMARVERPYLDDVIAEGALSGPLAASPSLNGISNLTYQVPVQLGSSQLPGRPTDVFDISNFPDLLYQAFMGIDPPSLRVFLQQPFRTDQGSFPVTGFQPAYAQQGWWDGFLSPFRQPNPKAQIIVLPGLSFGLGFANVKPQAVYPQLYFWINEMTVGVVTDAELVYEMVTVPGKARIVTAGGLQATSYTIKNCYKVPGVRLDMSRAEVKQGVMPQ